MDEQELFGVVKTYLAPDLKKTQNPYSVIDATSDMWRAYIEFKCRDDHYDELLLEKIKYNDVMREAAKHGYAPIYINSTPNGIYVFRLAEVKPLWVKRWLPKQTHFSQRQKIQKEVMFLPTSKASRAYHLPEEGDTELRRIV